MIPKFILRLIFMYLSQLRYSNSAKSGHRFFLIIGVYMWQLEIRLFKRAANKTILWRYREWAKRSDGCSYSPLTLTISGEYMIYSEIARYSRDRDVYRIRVDYQCSKRLSRHRILIVESLNLIITLINHRPLSAVITTSLIRSVAWSYL